METINNFINDKMDIIKALVNLGFAVFVALYLLYAILPAITEVSKNLQILVVLSDERKNSNDRIEKSLDKIYERLNK